MAFSAAPAVPPVHDHCVPGEGPKLDIKLDGKKMVFIKNVVSKPASGS